MNDRDSQDICAMIAAPENAGLIGRLRAGGRPVMELPYVLEPFQNSILPDPSTFDWIVFPDVASVGYFTEALTERGSNIDDLEVLRICALGEMTAGRLRDFWIHTDIISESRNEPFNAIAAYSSVDETGKLQVLIPRGSDRGVADLGDGRVCATEFPVYSKIAPARDPGKARALIAGGAFEEMIFCSPGDVENFIYITGRTDLTNVLANVQITCLDAATLEYLKRSGLNAAIFRQ